MTGNPGSEEFTWIGIGGWSYTESNLIQVGTFAYFPPGGGIHQGIWYETVPPNKAQFPLIEVSPGDRLFASIELVQPQTWSMLLVDGTSQATFSMTVQYNSAQAYADYVVEDPNETQSSGPPYYPLPRFSPVAFSNMQVKTGNVWTSASAVFGYRIMMAQSGRILVRAGSLSNSSFTATQV